MTNSRWDDRPRYSVGAICPTPVTCMSGGCVGHCALPPVPTLACIEGLPEETIRHAGLTTAQLLARIFHIAELDHPGSGRALSYSRILHYERIVLAARQ